MVKKVLGIIGAIIGVVGFALCVTSVFVSDASIQKILVKVAVALILFDVIVIGVCVRIFQIKDTVSTAKSIFGKIKKDKSPSENDYNGLTNSEPSELEKQEDDSVLGSQIRYLSSTDNYSTRFKYFNLIMIILFLAILVCAAITFLIKQRIAGLIMVACAAAVLILLLIINSIAEKKVASKRFDTANTNDARTDLLNSTFAPRQMTIQPIELDEASVSDAQIILQMQKIAFAELLEKYGDYDTSPANETLSKVESRFQDPDTYHYFIKFQEQIVGVIRVVDPKPNGKKRLSQIFVMPEFRLNGYAHSAIKAVEEIHGSTGWELGTILQERSLMKFYMRLGYRVKNQTKRINTRMMLVVMEK